MSRLLVVFLVVTLLFSFSVCSVASFIGFGVRSLGQSAPGISVRTGSTGGPLVGGGGPGSGK